MFWLRWGVAQCCLSVIFGAFAAHGLKNALSDHSLTIFETAARYQFFHGLALILLVLVMKVYQVKLSLVAKGFAFGSVIFCGSLYALALSEIKLFGAITPIGGSLWVISWCVLFYKSFSFKH